MQLIEDAMPTFFQVGVEASMLATFHVLRCCEAGIPLERLDQTFFNQTISAIANADEKGLNNKNCKASSALRESLELYVSECRPETYEHVTRKPFMTPIFQDMAKQMHTAFKNHVAENFSIYLCRWLRLQIDQDPPTTPCTINNKACQISGQSLIKSSNQRRWEP